MATHCQRSFRLLQLNTILIIDVILIVQGHVDHIIINRYFSPTRNYILGLSSPRHEFLLSVCFSLQSYYDRKRILSPKRTGT